MKMLSRCTILLLAAWMAIAETFAFDNGINDLHGGTPAPPGSSPTPPGPDPGPDDGPTSGDPVALFTGQYLLNALDFEIPGRMPLRVARFYRSASTYQGMFGRGWNMEFNERLFVVGTNANLVLRRDESARDEFEALGDGTYRSLGGTQETIVRSGDGVYTLTDKHGRVRVFNPDGTLREVRDRNWNQLILTYHPGGKLPISAVSDRSHFTNAILVARDHRLARIEVAFSNALSGRFISFAYDGSGRVTNVVDFTGRSWRYEYDAAGNGELRRVVSPAASGFPMGLTTVYGYTTNHLIETVTDRSGNTLLTNRYDTAGRVVRQQWGTNSWSFAYPSATIRWETNGNGYRTYRAFNASGTLLEKRDYTAGLRPGEPAFYATLYSSTSNQKKTVLPAGNVVVETTDAFGNVVEIRKKASDSATNQPDDIVTTSTFEPRFHQVKTLTDPRGFTTTFIYDYEVPGLGKTNGSLVRIESPAPGGGVAVISYTHDRFGNVDSVTDVTGRVTRYFYDPATGFLLQKIDAFGTPQARTNAWTYDSRGNAITETDPLGRVTTHSYDSMDRLVESTSPAPFLFKTQFSYTGNGRIAQIRRQTGDAAQPWQITTYTYDLLDRLVSVQEGTNVVLQIAHDANGNPVRQLDANTNLTLFAYDERNLPWRTVDALSNTVTLYYNANGLLSRRVDPRTNSTWLAYDAFDRIVAVTNADLTVEQYAYDKGGNVTQRRFRAGHTNTFEHDALSRLVVRRFSDNTAMRQRYDIAGRITEVTNRNGVWRYEYDVFGRILRSTNSHGKRLEYAYDRVGNLTRLTYPDNSFLLYAYDSLNRLTNINYSGIRNIASFTYDPLGRRTSLDFGNGTRAQYTYDSVSRMAQVTHDPIAGGPPLARFTYAFDPAGNRISQQTHGTRFPGQTTFEYDRIYQLTRVQYPAGSPFPTTSFTYDRNGNRTRVTAGSSVAYAANAMNQYTSVGGQPYTYEPDGELAGNGAWNFAYDDEEQLTSATGPGVAAHYAYDPFHRRSEKDVNGVGRQFVYSDVGDVPMLLAESDDNGTLQAKYVFYGLSPLAMIVGNEVFSLHCDHLERPVIATDGGGAVAWEGAYSAFGQTSLAPANSVAQPLRSPGQYEDAESGLQYNLARFYDPGLGRFLTEDPALEATSPFFTQIQERNAYAYLRNNPVNSVDPNGQSVFFIVCSAGIPVCSAALFCSLNAGACSGGLVCSANIGVCSAAAACSGNAGGGCSASIAACSASVAAACSGNAGGVCSGAAICSGQLGSGVGACSGSILACSGQAGVYGASACSANLVGGCSAQASVVGGSACSAQLAGACSAQVGAGASACSAQWAAGACSGQVGAGGSVCSGQTAGACSGQLGPGYSGCSAQVQGACSAQAGAGPGTCSGQGNTCSASSNCKQASLDHESNHHRLAGADQLPPSFSSLHVSQTSNGDVVVRFHARQTARYTVLAQQKGSAQWKEVASGDVSMAGLTQAVLRSPGDPFERVALRLENGSPNAFETGPLVAMQPPATGGPNPADTQRAGLFATAH